VLRHTRPVADEADSGGAAASRAEPAITEQATAGYEPFPAVLDDKPGLDDEDDRGHWRDRIWSALLTLIGAVSLVCGLTWALLNLPGPEPSVDLATGVVLALGGLVLLMPHRIRLPGLATGIAAVVAGIGGTAAGIAVNTSLACCMFAYVEDRGFPYFWLHRGGVADHPVVAQRLATTASWHVDVTVLTLNLLLWAYVGVLVVALVVLVRRASSRR